jgi:NhaP-type Na+/H+ or K+/H+ antiporter
VEPDAQHLILETIVAAVFLGILAQVLAERFRLPAIMPLLLLGMAAGPQGLGLLDPRSLGHGLEVFIHLGVAIILFEGGLSLDPRNLRQVGAPVRNLLTIGVAVTGVAAAWLAHAVTGLPWPTAALFGAVVTVTGPTVIVPLLRHMIAPAKVRTVLVSEGLIVDPVGAVLAYLVLQWIERAGQALEPLARELLMVAAIGAGVGFIAGMLARGAAKSRLFAGELRNLAILALLLGGYLVAETQAPQSGILAAVVMGFTMSAADIPDLAPVKVFKGQLTVLLISVLFILLSGQLDLGAMAGLGWRGLLVAAGLILLVRPLAVLASVRGSHMDWRSRVVLALTAPRGIVAAAVASLSAIQLRQAGHADGAAVFEGLVYLVILVTGAWATAAAVALPRILGFGDDPKRRRTVLVGANPVTAALAEALLEGGRQVAVVDAVGPKLRPLREIGVQTVRGDARDAATYESAGVERDTQVVALTTNDELNLLVAELVREEFGVAHPVVAMQQPSEEFGRLRRAWMDLLGGRAVKYEQWMRALQNGVASAIAVDPAREDALEELRDRLSDGQEADGAVFLCGWLDGEPSFRWKSGDMERFETVTVLAAGAAAEALARYAPRPEEGEAAEAGTENEPAAEPPRSGFAVTAEERVQPVVPARPPEPARESGGGES